MREDKVIEALRGSPRRLHRAKVTQIAVHVLRDGNCTVQVGSRVVLEDVSESLAMIDAESRKDRLKFSGINASIEVFRE